MKQFEEPNISDPLDRPLASCYRRLVRPGVRCSPKVVGINGTIIRVVVVPLSRISHSHHCLSGARRHFRELSEALPLRCRTRGAILHPSLLRSPVMVLGHLFVLVLVSTERRCSSVGGEVRENEHRVRSGNFSPSTSDRCCTTAKWTLRTTRVRSMVTFCDEIHLSNLISIKSESQEVITHQESTLAKSRDWKGIHQGAKSISHSHLHLSLCSQGQTPHA